jgi:hypothetical protein
VDCSDEDKSSGTGKNTGCRFNGECHYCHKKGHKKEDCRKLKADKLKSKGNRQRQREQAKTAIDEINEDDKWVDESIAELGFVGKDPASKQVTFKNVELNQAETAMMCTIDGAKYPSFTEDTMFGNSGTSCHILKSDNSMYEVEQIHESIGGIGSDAKATKKGKLRSLIKQAGGTSTIKVLQVKYCAIANKN